MHVRKYKTQIIHKNYINYSSFFKKDTALVDKAQKQDELGVR